MRKLSDIVRVAALTDEAVPYSNKTPPPVFRSKQANNYFFHASKPARRKHEREQYKINRKRAIHNLRQRRKGGKR